MYILCRAHSECSRSPPSAEEHHDEQVAVSEKEGKLQTEMEPQRLWAPSPGERGVEIENVFGACFCDRTFVNHDRVHTLCLREQVNAGIVGNVGISPNIAPLERARNRKNKEKTSDFVQSLKC